MNQESDDLPDLEDFSDQIQKLRPKKNESQDYIGDYSEPINERKQVVNSIITQDKKEAEQFSGLKKGFFDSKPNTQKKEKELEIIKPTEKKKNPLEIDEVQQNMNSQPNNLGSFLNNNKSQWLNEELLSKIATNPKLQKLFSNPEYMQAIQQMQHKPQETMQKYQNNPEFMLLFQEFAKVMGGHFEALDVTDKSDQKQQNSQQSGQQNGQQNSQQNKQVIIKQYSKKTHEEIIQDTIQNDPEVREILQDKKVVAFIEYLQRTRRADFHEILQKDPQLGKKIEVLIKKGILNVQQ